MEKNRPFIHRYCKKQRGYYQKRLREEKNPSYRNMLLARLDELEMLLEVIGGEKDRLYLMGEYQYSTSQNRKVGVKMEKITARELKLADTIRLGDYPFSDATVKRIGEEAVTLYRPHAHTADFCCTDGVICYTGVEEVRIPLNASRTYMLLDSKTLK